MKKIVALFDFDGTLIKGDSFREFLKFNLKKNFDLLSFINLIWTIILRKFRLVTLIKAKEQALNCVYSGKSESEWEAICIEFAINVLGPLMSKEIVSKINWHKKHGHLVILISSAPNIYFDNLKEKLNLDYVSASDVGYSNGKAHLIYHCFGVNKLTKLKELLADTNIDWSKSYAYSDHHSDIPLLSAVKYPNIVSPTRKLRKYAIKREWSIIINIL